MNKLSKIFNTTYIYLAVSYDFTDCEYKNGYRVYKQVSLSGGIYIYNELIKYNLMKRANWVEHDIYNTNNTNNMNNINFSLTNSQKVQTKSNIITKILFNTPQNIISNKSAFYDYFSDCDFIVPYIKLSNNNINNNYININSLKCANIIVKPDDGEGGDAILIIKNDENSNNNITTHIMNNTKYANWTVSDLVISKLYNNHIVSNRVYMLVVINYDAANKQKTLKTYMYDEFMNYTTMEELDSNMQNNFTDFNKRFITNYYNRNTDSKNIVHTDYVPHSKYTNIFTNENYVNLINKTKQNIATISDKIKDKLIYANDSITDRNHMAFHLYGIDQIITPDNQIKILEINANPRLYTYNEIKHDIANGHINYNVMIDEMLKKTIDVIYNTSITEIAINYENSGNICDASGNIISRRQFIECYSYIMPLNNKNNKIFIVKNIREKYSFIEKALYDLLNKNGYTITKNPHDPNIFFFYGFRDRYFQDLTSMNYYDELLEYKQSECAINATIINKIQGITYYLGSKDRLYMKLLEKYTQNIVNDFHPESYVITSNNYDIKQNKCSVFAKKKKYILKPAYGSQGKGIIVFNNINNIDDIIKESNETYKTSVYILSTYIDNPKLYKINITHNNKTYGDVCGRKFNIRFYVLITMDDLPTYHNMDKARNINYYILHDAQIYFALSEYKQIVKPDYIKCEISENILDKTKNLTNLEIINQINLNLETNNKIDTSQFIMSFDNMDFSPKYKQNIRNKFAKICDLTLNCIKNDLRNINRHNYNNNKAFNLTAYDMMIDSNDKLWLIEVNRGPDLVGLHKTTGSQKIYNIFHDMFNIIVNNYDKSEYWTKYAL